LRNSKRLKEPPKQQLYHHLPKQKSVKIQVGKKQYHQDGSLNVLKGRTLPLTVDADSLLQEAIKKHSKHF
jgi:predicted RecA/RadA family phage recombinase